MKRMRVVVISILVLSACCLRAAEKDSDIPSHQSVVISNLVAESHAIVRGTLTTGVMGEIDAQGDAILFVHIKVLEVIKRPTPPKPDPEDPFTGKGQSAKPSYPYSDFTKGSDIRILWYTQEDGRTSDRANIPIKKGDTGIFFLRIQDGVIVNADRWFSYHPDNSKLIEEIKASNKTQEGIAEEFGKPSE